VRWKNLSCVAWFETLWYSCVRTTHKSPTNSQIWNTQSGGQRGEGWWLKRINLLTSLWPTCQSSPHTPNTSWHTWHRHLSNIWIPERKFVKSPTLLRLKTRFLSRWNPGKFDPKFQQKGSPMRYDISKKKLRRTPQNFGLQRPRGPTRPITCFCFCSLFRKGHHCGNRLFPVSLSVILTENPIAAESY